MCKTCNYVIVCVGTEIDLCTCFPFPSLFHHPHSSLRLLKWKRYAIVILHTQFSEPGKTTVIIIRFVHQYFYSFFKYSIYHFRQENHYVTCIYGIDVNNLSTRVFLLPHSGLQFVLQNDKRCIFILFINILTVYLNTIIVIQLYKKIKAIQYIVL